MTTEEIRIMLCNEFDSPSWERLKPDAYYLRCAMYALAYVYINGDYYDNNSNFWYKKEGECK